MPTPIEELTARECAEGAAHTGGPQKGQPVMPEIGPAPAVIEEVALPPQEAPVLTNPDKTPLRSFLHHLQEEIAEEEKA